MSASKRMVQRRLTVGMCVAALALGLVGASSASAGLVPYFGTQNNYAFAPNSDTRFDAGFSYNRLNTDVGGTGASGGYCPGCYVRVLFRRTDGSHFGVLTAYSSVQYSTGGVYYYTRALCSNQTGGGIFMYCWKFNNV